MKFRSSIACATTMKSSVENFSMMLFLFGLLILILRTSPVSSSGFFELQFVEGVRNSTTIHVCLKEFWNSQINFNRCTFGQKTVIFHEHPSPKQSSIKIPFSFRWIVSSDFFFLFFYDRNLFSWDWNFEMSGKRIIRIETYWIYLNWTVSDDSHTLSSNF